MKRNHKSGEEVRKMWVSKRKWEAMEKRIADLEKYIQGQQKKEKSEQALKDARRILNTTT